LSQGNPSDLEIDTYAQEWINNGEKQAEAWRATYPKSTCSDAVCHSKASTMHKMGKVQERIAHYQVRTEQICADKHAVTVDSLIEELEEARELAKETGTPSALVAATMGKAKLSGLDIDKVEISGADMSPWNAVKGK